LRSVSTIDAVEEYPGGYNLNITLSGGTPAAVIRGLVRTFFSEGGQEVQINCVDAALLREARARPKEYGDLVVRVAGLSAIFVQLSDLEQQELIDRCEAFASS
jgi:formate C-acetyltransferase